MRLPDWAQPPNDHLFLKPEGGGYECHPGKRRECVICTENDPKGCALAMMVAFFLILALVAVWMIAGMHGAAGSP